MTRHYREEPVGWKTIIDELVAKHPDVDYAQIKEKFGALRVYCDAGDLSEDFENDLRLAERRCLGTCVSCGARADVKRLTGWVSPYCRSCYLPDYNPDISNPHYREGFRTGYRIALSDELAKEQLRQKHAQARRRAAQRKAEKLRRRNLKWKVLGKNKPWRGNGYSVEVDPLKAKFCEYFVVGWEKPKIIRWYHQRIMLNLSDRPRLPKDLSIQ